MIPQATASSSSKSITTIPIASLHTTDSNILCQLSCRVSETSVFCERIYQWKRGEQEGEGEVRLMVWALGRPRGPIARLNTNLLKLPERAVKWPWKGLFVSSMLHNLVVWMFLLYRLIRTKHLLNLKIWSTLLIFRSVIINQTALVWLLLRGVGCIMNYRMCWQGLHNFEEVELETLPHQLLNVWNTRLLYNLITCWDTNHSAWPCHRRKAWRANARPIGISTLPAHYNPPWTRDSFWWNENDGWDEFYLIYF